MLGQPHLLPHRPACSLNMAPMHHEQPIVGELSQPQAERHRRLAQIALKPANRFNLGLLNHVRRIDTRPELRIEPELNELTQIRAVHGQEPVKRVPIPVAHLLE